jgi:hypothetical protein
MPLKSFKSMLLTGMKKPTFIILLAAIISGCVCLQTPCERPYSLVSGVCCLDVDGDGICDSDLPVCNPPYIRVGNECCLDLDGNGICDSDETTTTKVTTTVVETTSTTQFLDSSPDEETPEDSPGCETIYDCETVEIIRCNDNGEVVYSRQTPISCRDGVCRFRASREISSYPCGMNERCIPGSGCVHQDDILKTTTTTVVYEHDFSQILDRLSERTQHTSPTTTTTFPQCIDSDGGLRIYDKSDVVSGIFLHNRTYFEASEHCKDGQTLVEYFCESGYVNSRIVQCPGICIDGRCCKTHSSLCASDKECCSGRCAHIGMSKYCV